MGAAGVNETAPSTCADNGRSCCAEVGQNLWYHRPSRGWRGAFAGAVGDPSEDRSAQRTAGKSAEALQGRKPSPKPQIWGPLCEVARNELLFREPRDDAIQLAIKCVPGCGRLRLEFAEANETRAWTGRSGCRRLRRESVGWPTNRKKDGVKKSRKKDWLDLEICRNRQ